jgi:hypothetical protein
VWFVNRTKPGTALIETVVTEDPLYVSNFGFEWGKYVQDNIRKQKNIFLYDSPFEM